MVEAARAFSQGAASNSPVRPFFLHCSVWPILGISLRAAGKNGDGRIVKTEVGERCKTPSAGSNNTKNKP